MFLQEEYEALKNKKIIIKDSPLMNYKPYLDEKELLRLGDRLEFCNLTIPEKLPIFLPKTFWLTILIV